MISSNISTKIESTLIAGGVCSAVSAASAAAAYVTNLANPIAAAIFSASAQACGIITKQFAESDENNGLIMIYLKIISNLVFPIIFGTGVLFTLGYTTSFAEISSLVIHTSTTEVLMKPPLTITLVFFAYCFPIQPSN